MEGALVFHFGAGWSVDKYDEHIDYKGGIMRLVGTRAVDFVGLHESEREGKPSRQLHFIEVKDFRGYRIQNKQRISDGDLAVEVALKVRDTIAGIVGAYRGTWGQERWGTHVRALTAREPIRVALWLEEDHPASRTMPAPPSPALIDDLKRQLFWLRAHVLVLNRACSAGHVPSLFVENKQ